MTIAFEVSENAAMFRCETCSWGRHCDASNPAPFKKFVIKGVIESATCFLPMITQQSRFLLRLFSHYRRNMLPEAGGLLDQPNYYLEAMEFLNGLDVTAQLERLERSKKEAHFG